MSSYARGVKSSISSLQQDEAIPYVYDGRAPQLSVVVREQHLHGEKLYKLKRHQLDIGKEDKKGVRTLPYNRIFGQRWQEKPDSSVSGGNSS